jgi:hypothetical protein
MTRRGCYTGDIIGGRDPTFSRTPNLMALARPNALYDIGFGYGSHCYPGFAVAKAEMEEASLPLTHRLHGTALDGDVILDPKGLIAGADVVPINASPYGIGWSAALRWCCGAAFGDGHVPVQRY